MTHITARLPPNGRSIIPPRGHYKNMTLSAKPEVRNISQRSPKRTEPRPQATCIEIWVKFARVVPEICQRTDNERDRQTDRQTYSSQYFVPSHMGSKTTVQLSRHTTTSLTCAPMDNNYFSPREGANIAMSMSDCLSVCSLAHITQKPYGRTSYLMQFRFRRYVSK